MRKSEPQPPQGTSSTLRGLSKRFSFHSSPESFITSRLIDFQKQHSEVVDSRAVVRAKVLNRNVSVVSSYAQIKQVLEDDDAGYEASGAYTELMAPFSPSPNLLLMDGLNHAEMRKDWEQKIGPLREILVPLVHREIKKHICWKAH
jgi:cytochrome P450